HFEPQRARAMCPVYIETIAALTEEVGDSFDERSKPRRVICGAHHDEPCPARDRVVETVPAGWDESDRADQRRSVEVVREFTLQRDDFIAVPPIDSVEQNRQRLRRAPGECDVIGGA